MTSPVSYAEPPCKQFFASLSKVFCSSSFLDFSSTGPCKIRLPISLRSARPLGSNGRSARVLAASDH